MAAEKKKPTSQKRQLAVSSSIEDLLLAALERGDESLETGRYLVTYRDNATAAGLRSLKAQGFRVADARDFKEQVVRTEDVGDAEALMFPEIGVAVVSGAALEQHGLSAPSALTEGGPMEAIEPEYFVFAESSEFLRGFTSATNAIARELGVRPDVGGVEDRVDAEVMGATWGLVRCKVPPSSRSGLGIKVAVLDTGMDQCRRRRAGSRVSDRCRRRQCGGSHGCTRQFADDHVGRIA